MRGSHLRFLALCAAVAVFRVAGASGQVLFTTEEDFSQASSQNGANISVTATTSGDIDGSSVNGVGNLTTPGGTGTPGALLLTQNVDGYNQVSLGDETNNTGFLQALASHNLLSISYTLGQTIDTGTNGYFQIWGVFNWTGGYQQLSGATFFSNPANLTAGTHTATYDYSALQAGLPTSPPSYFQLYLVLNSGGSITPDVPISVTVDNISVGMVPEPASFSALAAGAGLALGRRRRK